MRTQAWVYEGPDALISLVKVPWRTRVDSHQLDANFYTNYAQNASLPKSDGSLEISVYQGSLAIFGVLIVPSGLENGDENWIHRSETLTILANTSNSAGIHTEAVHSINSAIHKVKHSEHFTTTTESGPRVLHVFFVEVALHYGAGDKILPLNANFELETSDGPSNFCTLQCSLVEDQVLSVKHRLVLNFLEIELQNLHDVWDAEVDEVSPSGINHEALAAQVPTVLKAGQRQSLLYKIEPSSVFKPCFLCVKWRIAIAQVCEWQWFRIEIKEAFVAEFSESDAIKVWCSINHVNLSLVSINVKIRASKAVNLILENDSSDMGGRDALLPIVKIVKIGRLEPAGEKTLVIHYNVINRGLSRISRFKLRDVLCSKVYKMKHDFYVMV